MAARTQEYITLAGPCPGCGGPLTTPKLARGEEQQYPASPATVRLCVLCVARALVRATLALHGTPGPHPESGRSPGHEERMRAHQERVAREEPQERVNDTEQS